MFLAKQIGLTLSQIKVEKSMNRLTFIGSIQLNSPSTGGGVQTKNQHFLRYILSKMLTVESLILGKKNPYCR